MKQSISIAVSDDVPEDVFARVASMAETVAATDSTFEGVAIAVTRARLDTVPVLIQDSDLIRRELLQLLVEEALKGQSDSLFGSL
jgi:hypothetical protein